MLLRACGLPERMPEDNKGATDCGEFGAVGNAKSGMRVA
jgi:hypothetical protein